MPYGMQKVGGSNLWQPNLHGMLLYGRGLLLLLLLLLLHGIMLLQLLLLLLLLLVLLDDRMLLLLLLLLLLLHGLLHAIAAACSLPLPCQGDLII